MRTITSVTAAIERQNAGRPAEWASKLVMPAFNKVSHKHILHFNGRLAGESQLVSHWLSLTSVL